MKKKTKKSAPKKRTVSKKSAKKTVTKKSSAKTKTKVKENKKNSQKAKKKSVSKPAKHVAKKVVRKAVTKSTKAKKQIKSTVTYPSRTVTPALKKGKNIEVELMKKSGLNIEAEQKGIKSPKSADITKEEFDVIRDDEELKDRAWDADMSGEDLDVPGSELDDDMEDLGSEDEENNPYSIGGDRHEDLDENKDLGR